VSCTLSKTSILSQGETDAVGDDEDDGEGSEDKFDDQCCIFCLLCGLLKSNRHIVLCLR